MRSKKRIVLLLLTLLLTSCGNQSQVKNSSVDIDSKSESKLNEIAPSEPQGFMEIWNQQLSNEGIDELNKLEKEVDEFNKQIFYKVKITSSPDDLDRKDRLIFNPYIVACQPGCEKIDPFLALQVIYIDYDWNQILMKEVIYKIGSETLNIPYEESEYANNNDFDTVFGKAIYEVLTYPMNDNDEINFLAKIFETEDEIEVKVYGSSENVQDTYSRIEIGRLKSILLAYRYLKNEDNLILN
jgi:hypothetical protein